MEMKKVHRVRDYESHVNWVLNEYNEKGFVHGFQKDAIQNAVGAAIDSSGFRNWRCEISIVNTSKGTFLIVEDFGTKGLTGHNYDQTTLEEKTAKHEQFPAEERLARISCDNVSGGDSNSPGLFGVGKTLYVAASKCYTNFFDSITENEGYRCNCNEKDMMLAMALEEDQGKDWIYAETGLEPISHIGTRFIIKDPKEEIIQGILGEDEEMLHAASETWWRIIRRMNPEDGIFINGKRAEVPEAYQHSEDEDVNERDSFFTQVPVTMGENHRYKKMGFYISDNLPDDLTGFYYYRRGMKIGKINIDEFVRDIDSKYYGFIELEPSWENELGLIENSTHYDTQGKLKTRTEYALMRRAVQGRVSSLMEEWGYSKTKANQQRYLNSLLSELNDDVASFFADKGFEKIGDGNKKSSFTVRLLNVAYPHADEPKYARSMFSDDQLNFGFQIRNRSASPVNYKVSCVVKGPDGGVVEQIYSKTVKVDPGLPFEDKITFTSTPNNSVSGQVNAVVLSVSRATGSSKSVDKKLYYYFGTETFVRPQEDFSFDRESAEFENEPSKRINTDEWVRNITYVMVNRTTSPVKVIIRVNTNNGAGKKELLQNVVKKEYILPPFGEEVISEPIDIQFSSEDYFSKIRKGIIEVRAKMVLNQDLPENDPPLDRSTVLGEYKFKVFFNKPDSSGNNFESQLIYAENEPRRVYLDPSIRNKILINIAHPQYLADTNPAAETRYISEMLIRGYIMVFESNGYFNNAETENMSGSDYNNYINQQIERMWFEKCKATR